MFLLALWIFGLDITHVLAVSTLTATLQNDCACYGNDETIDSIMPNCSSSNGIISINSVYRGAKLSSTGCPNIATAADRDETNCCTYNAADDCRLVLSSDTAATAGVFTDCAGAASCSKRVTWQDTASDCSGGYLSQTNYMCMDYYCFPTADITTFCDTSGTVYTGSQLYFFNDNYPGAIPATTDCCSCTVAASANSATIDVNIIDFRLYDEASTCVQALLIQDGTNLTSYGCTTNNDFITQKLITSTTNSVTVALQNNATTANGYMFVGVVVSNGALTVTCSAVSTCPDGSATTTTTATSGDSASTSGSETASSSDSDETLLFGLSMMYSIMIMTGALLLLLILVIAAGCCIGYKIGQSKTYNMQDKTTNGKPRRMLTTDNVTPTPYKAGNTPRTTLYETRASDVSKNTMFTYRQFDNRYTTPRGYGRRGSLTRVESF